MSGLPTEQAKAEKAPPSAAPISAHSGADDAVARSQLESASRPLTMPAPLGLYVHVPFCASTCDFCAFYQTQPTADGMKQFLSAIECEASLVEWPRPVTSVFWGGGTPGLLAPRDLARLAEIIRARFGGSTGMGVPLVGLAGSNAHGREARATPIEWTIELAPGSVTEERLSVLRDAGVTRVSMGVQSFQPDLLDALGRQHTREQIFRGYDRIRAAGFRSVNLDLMFALPGQTAAEWAGDIREAVSLGPDHISTYCLTFEEDTKLWVKLSQGRVKLDTELEAALYEATWSQLADCGYAQYEISNFCRPRHECIHNVNTWRMHEWIGLGPSAASQHDGWRGGNVADLEQWRSDLGRGVRMTEDRVALTPALLAEDALIFGLRMNAGVDLGIWRERAPLALWRVVEDTLATLAAGGLLLRDGSAVKLTNRGRLVADSVGAEIMAAFEPLTKTA